MDYSDHHPKKHQGSIAHKIFKLVILIIVAVFMYFIISFIRIEFFKSDNPDYNFDMNFEYYKYLYDNDITLKNKIKLDECSLDNFFVEDLAMHMPCIISHTNKGLKIFTMNIQSILKSQIEESKDKIKTTDLIGMYTSIGTFTNFEFFDLSKIFLRIGLNSTLEPNAEVDNKDKFFIQLKGVRTIYISPISQINLLKPFHNKENKNNEVFNKIYTKINLSLNQENKEIIIIKTILNEGDALYVPSYYFIEETTDKKNLEASLKFEYFSNMRTLNTMYQVLFDNDLGDSSKNSEN